MTDVERLAFFKEKLEKAKDPVERAELSAKILRLQRELSNKEACDKKRVVQVVDAPVKADHEKPDSSIVFVKPSRGQTVVSF